MGLGGISRNVFQYFRTKERNIANEFNKEFCNNFNEINIAIDTNIILHSVYGNDNVDEKQLYPFLRYRLPYRALGYLKRILNCFDLEQHHVNICIVTDNGKPAPKEFERIKRLKRGSHFKNQIIDKFDYINIFCEKWIPLLVKTIFDNHKEKGAVLHDNLTISECTNIRGEGEHNCVKYLSNKFQKSKNETDKQLNLVVSTDSDLMTYCIANAVTHPDKNPICFLNSRKVLRGDVDIIYIYNFIKFADYLHSNVCYNRNALKAYLTIILSLHGNDFLPCVLNSKLKFKHLSKFTIKFIAANKQIIENDGFTFSLFKQLLSEANNENMLKHSARMKEMRSKKDQLVALLAWFSFIEKVVTYNLEASQHDLFQISTFLDCDPFKHFVYFNSCFNQKTWKTLLSN